MKFEALIPSEKTTILFLSWRDISAPKKGGAEVYTHEMLKRINLDQYRIIHFSPMFEGGLELEDIDGILYLRDGSVISVISKAKEYFVKNQEHIDFVVDQCNTHRFFSKFWVPDKKRIFFIHQLTREIWDLNAKFPISTIGKLTETPFLRLSRNDYTMTVSESTRRDLIDIGFDKDKVVILPEGIDFKHWEPEDFCDKQEATFVYVGRFVNYKGIDATIEAYALLKSELPEAKLWIIGKKNQIYYDERIAPVLEKKDITCGGRDDGCDITMFGFVSDEEKLKLMSMAKALIFPSQREGWGLIVTEAAAVGTPSIVYDSPGIIDAVDFGKSGFLCEKNDIDSIYKLMKTCIYDDDSYSAMRQNAYEFSLNFHWDNTAKSFDEFIDYVTKNKAKR